MRRAATTVVLITRQNIVRADLSSGAKPQLLGLWEQARPDVPDLATLVEAALVLEETVGRKVWVLCTDLWMQNLAMPAVKVARLRDQELATALNFEVEAEALSGLSAFEAVVAAQRLPDSAATERNYWVLQMRREDRDQVDEIVQRAGSKLAGICHPGALPVPLAADNATAHNWQRVELWPDTVVLLNAEPLEPLRVRIINSDPALGRWVQGHESWQREFGPARRQEWLLAVEGELPAAAVGHNLMQLNDGASLQKWLLRWGELLAHKEPGLPIVRPVKRPLSTATRSLVAVALALCMGAVCFAHHRSYDAEIEQMRQDLKSAKKLTKTVADLDKSKAKLEKDRAALDAQTKQAQQTVLDITMQRARFGLLLQALAQHRSEHLLIQKIDRNGSAPRISGICLEPAMADQFARSLTQPMRELGWEVHSPRKEAKKLLTGGGPWSFEIQFRELSLTPSKARTRSKSPSTR
ncbi:MAG: hypothetical protein AB7K24_07550 [Gemmataceae bacterium]